MDGRKQHRWLCGGKLCLVRSVRHIGRAADGNIPGGRMMPRVGRTAAAIFGFLGAMASMPTAIMRNSTTFGSSIRSRTDGPGWAEAVHGPTRPPTEFMARWERRLPKIFPEVAMELRTGPTAAAIYGFLGARATMPTDNYGGFNDLWEFNPSMELDLDGRKQHDVITHHRATMASMESTARWGALCWNIPGGRAACKLEGQQRQSLAFWGRGIR